MEFCLKDYLFLISRIVGIALLCSSSSEENDVLWSISPDIFPFQKTLQESSVNIPLEGRAWALHEVPESTYPELPSPVPAKWPDPPAIVTQHALPSRKFVVLSAQVNSCSDVIIHTV
jgi:nuclear pore complex protein Nup155